MRRKRGEGEKQRDQVEVHGEDGGDEQQNADAAKDNQRFSRGTERPAAPNQVARNATAEEIAQIRSEKGNPHGEQAAFKRNAFCDEVDGKPVRDEKPNGIGKALGDDRSPGLRKLQEIEPSQPRLTGDLRFLGLGKNHLALGVTDARMILRQVVHPAPDDQPQESEQSRNNEGDAPSPTKVHRQNQKGRDRTADRGAAVVQRRRKAALALWKPFGNRFARAGPVGRFARAEQKTK